MIALKSCTGKGGWEGNLKSTLVAETTALLELEKFVLLGQ